MNIIDEFFVALGYKVDETGIDKMRANVDKAKESILGWGHALVGLVGGLALHEVAKIGSTFEQNRIQIAGFLSALGESSDFNAGLNDAAAVMQKITTDAAKLPGEAEEYIEVFKAGFPFVQGAMPGASLDQMTDFTNRLTAIGKTFGLDAGLIAREFDHMLSPDKGTASLRLPLFRQLLPFMKQVQGQAHLTAQSFNAMTNVQRLQLLQQTFARLQPMLDASADSFDAMWGTLVSAVKQLTRFGTGALFRTMKDEIGKFAATFVDADGKLTSNGKDLVLVLSQISSVVGTLIRDGAHLVTWLIKMTAHSTLFKIAIGGVLALIAGSAWNKGIGTVLSFMKGIRAATLWTGLLAIGLFLLVEDMYGYFTGAQSLIKWNSVLGGALMTLVAILGVVAAQWVIVKVQSVAAAVASAAAWAVANPMLLAAVAAVALLVLGFVELKKHSYEVAQFLEGIINRWINGLNKVIDAVNTIMDAFGAKGFQHVGYVSMTAKEGRALQEFHAPEHFRKLGEEQDVPDWLRPRGAAAATGGGSNVTHGPVTFGDINIKADNPREAGREVQRVLRTAQSGMVR